MDENLWASLVTSLAVTPAGTLYVTNSKGEIWKQESGKWSKMPALPLLQPRRTYTVKKGERLGQIIRNTYGLKGADVWNKADEIARPLRLASAADCARYLRDASPTLRAMFAPFSPQERQEAWQEIEEALSVFEGPEGFEALNEVLVAAGFPAVLERLKYVAYEAEAWLMQTKGNY